MSSLARWTYTNTATVKPFLGEDGENGGITYGTEYTIACTWTAEAKQVRDHRGFEFVSSYVIYTEDARPRYLDQILINEPGAPWQQIRARTPWDLSFFNDTTDFKLVT